jgi:hypothetical protein
MSHIATYLTSFNDSELFLKSLEQGRKELNIEKIKKITLNNTQHYQLYLKDKNILINFIWNNSSYEASVDLKNWQEKYSFESLLRKLYSFYVVELVEAKKEKLNLKEIVKNNKENHITINLIKNKVYC